MAADYSRIHRLLHILTLIQSQRGWTTARLAAECGKGQRTIFRDIEMLRAAGIPCHYDAEEGGYYIQKDFFMPPVELTVDEALALVALGKHLGGKSQIPFTGAAAKAIAKIRSQLPSKIRSELDDLDPYLSIKLPQTASEDGQRDVYDRVRHAITKRRALRCSYDSVTSHQRNANGHGNGNGKSPGGKDEVFTFKPYALFFSQRAWYVVGHHGGRGEVRTLKLSRFSRCEQTDQPYFIPDDFTLEKHQGNAWRMIPGKKSYDIELQVDRDFAETLADTNWHSTQSIEWQDDGSIIFRCKVDGLEEIVWWILGHGPHVVVRKPKELANQIRDLAAGIVANYSSQAS
jgi:predicted DNA-binding transcriptional regulator YafY